MQLVLLKPALAQDSSLERAELRVQVSTTAAIHLFITSEQ